MAEKWGPPRGSRLVDHGKGLRVLTLRLPMCSTDVPMARGGAWGINTNSTGKTFTSYTFLVRVQGVSGALTQCRRDVKFDTYGYVGVQYGSPRAPVMFPWLGGMHTVALPKI